MKNKHLVLLFLTVVILGLVVRHFPWRYRNWFQAELIRVDTADLAQCTVQLPNRPELVLERADNGWVATQLSRSSAVTSSQMHAMLLCLQDLHVLRMVKSTRPDTLGLSTMDRIGVVLEQEPRNREQFWLGRETILRDTPATYLQLPRHEGIYLVPGHLRRIFDRSLDDFRPRTIAPFAPESIRRIGLQWPDSLPVFLEKNDSTARWVSTALPAGLSNDSVQSWLQFFKNLDNSPFADNFDESHARQTALATIFLEPDSGDRVDLQFYYIKPPDLPEDLSVLRARGVRHLPFYVLHSSLNPVNFFAVADTSLVRRLCFGLLPPPSD